VGGASGLNGLGENLPLPDLDLAFAQTSPVTVGGPTASTLPAFTQTLDIASPMGW